MSSRGHRPERCRDGVGCSLWKNCTHVRIDGDGKARKPYVMFLGEAPGYHEDQQNKPFVGPAGKVIRHLIKEMGLEDDCYITNAVRCRPEGNRNPTAQEMRVCNKYLVAEIERVKPQHIVALGAFAIRALTGEDTVKVGAKRGIKSWEFLGIPVIATYHPAAVLRNKRLLKPLCEDLNRVVSKEYTRPEHVKWSYHRKVSPRLLWSSMAFDLETSQLSPYVPGGEILCVSWSGKDHVARVTRDVAGFVSALRERRPRLVGHNVKFDLSWLRAKLGYVHAGELDDTIVAAHLLNENRRNDLDSLAEHYTGYGSYGREIKKFKKGRMAEAPMDKLHEYCAYDSAACWILRSYFLKEIKDEGLETLYKQQIRVLRCLLEVESRGFQIDPDRIETMQIQLADQVASIGKRIERRVGKDFNPGSNPELADLLFNQLGYVPKKRTPKRAPSVDKEALELIEDDIPVGLSRRKARGLITDILGFRSASKMLSTYVVGVGSSLDESSRVHPSYNLIGTPTGRLSCSNPNQQNIPREKTAPIKQIYVAPRGRCLIDADFSQIELRIMAWESRDAAMMDCYIQGRDLHTETARAILQREPSDEERSHAKTVNFMTLYGGGAKRLSRLTGNNEQWSERYLRDWSATFPGILDWKRELKKELLDTGYVTNAFGRRRRLPLVAAHSSAVYDRMLRQACNHPIQGTAGEICNMAMVLVDQKLEQCGLTTAWVYGAVHDSILVECAWKDRRRVAAIMLKVMSNVNEILFDFGHDVEIDVPIEVDVSVGRCWAELEEVS